MSVTITPEYGNRLAPKAWWPASLLEMAASSSLGDPVSTAKVKVIEKGIWCWSVAYIHRHGWANLCTQVYTHMSTHMNTHTNSCKKKEKNKPDFAVHGRVLNRNPNPSLPQRQRAGRKSLGPQLPGYVRILSLWVFTSATHSKSESRVTAGMWNLYPQAQHVCEASGNRTEDVWQPGPLTRHHRLSLYPKMGC